MCAENHTHNFCFNIILVLENSFLPVNFACGTHQMIHDTTSHPSTRAHMYRLTIKTIYFNLIRARIAGIQFWQTRKGEMRRYFAPRQTGQGQQLRGSTSSGPIWWFPVPVFVVHDWFCNHVAAQLSLKTFFVVSCDPIRRMSRDDYRMYGYIC